MDFDAGDSEGDLTHHPSTKRYLVADLNTFPSVYAKESESGHLPGLYYLLSVLRQMDFDAGDSEGDLTHHPSTKRYLVADLNTFPSTPGC